MEELISIIVPVYKVENYIDKCIESIINQTYQKLEIILVDDGSPDKSGEKCEEYKKIDNRIFVVHKENGGLSDARNFGMKYATGKYIGFVDSDDYIDNKMFEKLYYNMKKYNANISMCSYVDEYESGRTEISKHFEKEITVLNKMNALRNLILEQNISNHVWNKLYERELFNGISFPAGKKMEDIATTYRLFEKANVIVVDNYIGYHYIQRGDSIMGNINEKLVTDTENNIMEKNEYLWNKYSELQEAITIENIKTYKLLHYLAKVGGLKNLINSSKYKNYYKTYKKAYLTHRKLIKENVGKKVIISYDLFWISKYIYFLYLNIK